MNLGVYEPRAAEAGVLHTVVREHLEDFLRAAAERTDGVGVPKFVEREFRKFLACGVLARGFARLRCGACGFERLVPFSCKGRAFCSSCGGRRMTERAAHLVDAVFRHAPGRQWVLTVPYRLRHLLAWDHHLCRAVLRVYVRVRLGFMRRRARRSGILDGRGGAVTAIQRSGSALNLNVHFHTLVLDGVVAAAAARTVQFHPVAPPTDADVARLLATIRARIQRLLARRGLDPGDPTSASPAPLIEESLALAGSSSASIQNRVALGPRAGARVLQFGRDPDAPWVMSRGPRQAHLEGFDLHANLAVRTDDRAALVRLCRYVLRPPVAQTRLQRLTDGRVLLTLKGEWSDGTTHVLFAPVALLERLAALGPRPRITVVIYHGLLAPHAAGRRAAVNCVGESPRTRADPARDPVAPDAGAAPNSARNAAPVPSPPLAPAVPDAPPSPRYWTWAHLMCLAFDLDVLYCRRRREGRPVHSREPVGCVGGAGDMALELGALVGVEPCVHGEPRQLLVGEAVVVAEGAEDAREYSALGVSTLSP